MEIIKAYLFQDRKRIIAVPVNVAWPEELLPVFRDGTFHTRGELGQHILDKVRIMAELLMELPLQYVISQFTLNI